MYVSLIVFLFILICLFVFDVIWLCIVLIMVVGFVLGFNNVLFMSYVMEVFFYEWGIISGGYNFLRWLGVVFVFLLLGVIGNVVVF